MPVTSHENREDTLLEDGYRRIRWRYYMHTGEILDTAPKRVPGNWDDDTERANHVPVIEWWFNLAEQDAARGYVASGGNPLDPVNNPIHSTTKELSKTLVWRVMDMKNDPILPEAVRGTNPLFEEIALLTPQQQRNLLDITEDQRIRMNQTYKNIMNVPDPAQSADVQIGKAHDSAEPWGNPNDPSTSAGART